MLWASIVTQRFTDRRTACSLSGIHVTELVLTLLYVQRIVDLFSCGVINSFSCFCGCFCLCLELHYNALFKDFLINLLTTRDLFLTINHLINDHKAVLGQTVLQLYFLL